ncbi:MAG: DUF885 family protein [Longimicrobiales bacterium]
MSLDPDAVLDRFFDAYYRARPVNATFIGVHDFDGEWPDFTEHGAGDVVGEMTAQLAALEALEADSSGLASEPWEPRFDVRLAAGYLRQQLWEYESAHFHQGNPSLYTGEAAFGIISLFLGNAEPLDQRVASATERLAGLPAFLDQLRANVRIAPPAWTERALRECRGVRNLLEVGLDHLDGAWPADTVSSQARTSLRRERDGSLKALGGLEHYLNEEIGAAGPEVCQAGEEAFRMYLREGHCVDDSPQELLRYALSEIEEVRALVKDVDAAEDQRLLQARRSTAEAYYDRYQELWDQVRATAVAQDLVTWPEFPIEYLPRPNWTRAAAPDLYFLFYRSPAAFDRPPVHKYLVTPLDSDASVEAQDKVLKSTHDAVIKLNHVIHHGSIGHHVQNWHAFRSKSRVGRIAAVDCASRIAMFCGGTMAEGWACYATDLMNEAGSLTPLEQRAEQRSRIRMCARAVADIRLHLGEFTLDEAATYYVEQAGMSAPAGRSEAVKNSMFPGAAVMYMLGRDRIHTLRREMSALQGAGFSLKGFHDEFLAFGSVPVQLIAEEMVAVASGGRDRSEGAA